MVKARQLNQQPDQIVRNTFNFVKEIRQEKAMYGKVKNDDTDLVQLNLLTDYREFFERFRTFKLETLIY